MSARRASRANHAEFRIVTPGRCQPIPAQRWKFNLISTLSAFWRAARRAPRQREGVDGAGTCLYKTGNGGGRNPAAAVL